MFKMNEINKRIKFSLFLNYHGNIKVGSTKTKIQFLYLLLSKENRFSRQKDKIFVMIFLNFQHKIKNGRLGVKVRFTEVILLKGMSIKLVN